MNARTVCLVGALALGLAACPPAPITPDAGEDSGVDNPQGPCTGGCGPLQVCDQTTHQCVDGCGGCDAGVCVKNAAGAFQCIAQTTSCNGSQCSPGQVACVSGTCSCLPFNRASSDTCAIAGSICKEPYNVGTASGGLCVAPNVYEACKSVGCAGGTCAACVAGSACKEIFGAELCLKKCTANANCNRDEFCSSDGCLPKAVFGTDPENADAGASYDCIVKTLVGVLPDGGTDPDGGFWLHAVAAGNACALVDDTGFPLAAETVPTGNCSYDFLRFSNQLMPVNSCRPPGAAGLNQVCKRDTSATTTAFQCNTGLECAVTRGDTGMCLKMCNAVPPRMGIVSKPACGTGEACVNLYRLEDLNSVVGVCMPTCNVFSTTGQTCADYGTVKASCVPVPADGVLPVSQDGAGICVPQKAAVAAAGEPCAEPDSFKGAACATGLLCSAMLGTDQPVCQQPCDVACSSVPAPARCATEPNATCPGGKTCTRISGSTGVTLGVCK